MGTKRIVSPADQAKFFAAITAGQTITQASRTAGIHVNTGSKWLAKARAAEAEAEAVAAAAKTSTTLPPIGSAIHDIISSYAFREPYIFML